MKNFEQYIPANANPHTHGNVISFEVAVADIVQVVRDLFEQKSLSLGMIDATDNRAENNGFTLWYVFNVPRDNVFIVPYIRVAQGSAFPSVASSAPAMGWCERKIKDMFGLQAEGNQDERRLLLHENFPSDFHPLCKDVAWDSRASIARGNYKFQHVDGEGIYEIPVGPIHAGIIEPGHFRFSMAGESIMLLEARLGYVHKGHEKLFEILPMEQKLRLAEKISGDSSFAHSLAFCQAVEQLADIAVPERAAYLRTIFAELERLACHIGDIGFIMLDTGFNFGGAQGQRLREGILRMNERLTGSRFLRGVNIFGGVTKDIPSKERPQLAEQLSTWLRDAEEVIAIAQNSASFINRAKTTGVLQPLIARDYGALGYAARAAGMQIDARCDHPYAAYSKLSAHKIALEQDSDVYARFCVRVQEVRNSVAIIHEALKKMPASGATATTNKIKLQPNAIAIGCVEGWRGEILHFVITDKSGAITRVAVRDPSCINWQVVGSCGNGNIVPDFPLINKSFNLSYTGNDL